MKGGRSGADPPEKAAPATPAPPPSEGSHHNEQNGTAPELINGVERIPFRIIVANDIWGTRVLVSVEPRQCDKPTRSFRRSSEALAFAGELARLNSWPIEDRREFFDGAER